MTVQSMLRSFLFVPAANEKLVASAAAKAPDAVILDLEDGTHPSKREMARDALPAAYRVLAAAGKVVAVRINGDLLTAATDLRAAVCDGLDLLVLPKVEHERDVHLISMAVSALEREAGIAGGRVKFLLQIESAAALPRLHAIASADPRVMGMMLGSEDFSLDCGGVPTPDALYAPSLMVLYAARAAGIQPIGFIGSIADLGSEEEFREKLQRARALGFRGAVVVHPKFVGIANACFTPSAEEVAWARKVIEAFEAADGEGLGAIRVDGQMVDKPIYRRSLRLVEEAR